MSIRKALLVGINAYTSAPLKGCVNDILQIKEFLKCYYGFTDDGMQILLDRDATGANIQAGLAWLAQGGGDTDAVRIFHYSGHGTYVADCNGDEPDGRDEAIAPYDYASVGVLTDDALKKLYDVFPRAGNLTLIMDSCYSGSVQRADNMSFRFLPVIPEEQTRIDAARERFEQDQDEFVTDQLMQAMGQGMSAQELRQKVSRLVASFKKQRFGDIRVRERNMLLAACRADQTAADAYINGEHHGAFTHNLADAITASQGRITYRDLVTQAAGGLSRGGFIQVPQLEYRGERDRQLVFQPFA